MTSVQWLSISDINNKWSQWWGNIGSVQAPRQLLMKDSEDVWPQRLSQRQVFSGEAAPSAPKLQGQQMLHSQNMPRLCIALRNPGVPGLLAGVPISVSIQTAVAAPRMPQCSKPACHRVTWLHNHTARAGVSERWSILKGKWRIMHN